MADFRPSRAAPLAIGPVYYHFTPHPLFPDEDEVYAIEGGEAVIYQLWRQQDNTFWALKVSHSSFRGPHIARSTDALRPFAHLPGLYLGNRVCLTKAHYGDLIDHVREQGWSVRLGAATRALAPRSQAISWRAASGVSATFSAKSGMMAASSISQG